VVFFAWRRRFLFFFFLPLATRAGRPRPAIRALCRLAPRVVCLASQKKKYKKKKKAFIVDRFDLILVLLVFGVGI
jgi:hypothetical protein